MDSPKKRTNEFVFTTVLLVFVRFLGESMAWQICFWNYLTFNSVWKKNLLMKIQTFRNLLSTQHASNLCFSSQACQLTMGKIYKNKKDPHLTLAEKNNIKRREKCFVTKIVLTYCEKKNVLVIEKKLLKFEAKGREFSNFLTWLEQFIQTVKECFFNLFLEVSQI